VADQNQQNQAAQNAEAQRRADEQRRAQQPPSGASAQPLPPRGGQQQGSQQDASQRGLQQGQEVARQRFEEEKRMIAERPQQVGNEGSQPTPTQQENDEIRAGLRHIDDKENDRSGADLKLVRRFEAEESKGKYETR
jgi:hypothetical protein